MPNVNTMLKAIYGAVAALLAGLGSALVQSGSFGHISDASWITIASLTVAAFGAVYGVTNTLPPTAVVAPAAPLTAGAESPAP